VRSMRDTPTDSDIVGAGKKVAPRGSDDAPVSRTGKSSAPHIFHIPASKSYRVHVEGGHE